MSNFLRKTKHPKTGEWEQATWLDTGREYKVHFPDGSVYDEEEIKEWRDSYTMR